mgnify:CR=1 FL=1
MSGLSRFPLPEAEVEDNPYSFLFFGVQGEEAIGDGGGQYQRDRDRECGQEEEP